MAAIQNNPIPHADTEHSAMLAYILWGLVFLEAKRVPDMVHLLCSVLQFIAFTTNIETLMKQSKKNFSTGQAEVLKDGCTPKISCK